MKYIFKTDVDEQARMIIKASDMHSCLFEISQMFRSAYKYEEWTDEQYKVVETLRERFFNILKESEIVL